MAENSPEQNNSSFNGLWLNAAIGFLSVLLLVLLIALTTRIIIPRIFNERSDDHSLLISEIIQIEVLNGCGIAGIANQFTGILRSNGFDVVETGNFDHFDLKETIVISRSGITANALQVANALGVRQENVIIEASKDFYLDVTVVIGHDHEQLNRE